MFMRSKAQTLKRSPIRGFKEESKFLVLQDCHVDRVQTAPEP